MEKIKLNNAGYMYPMPMTLVGTSSEGRPNFMAVAWISRVNNQPPVLAAAINNRHLTNKAIRENKEFSVNIPGIDLLEKTDFCGLVSGKYTDKSGLFEVFHGELENAPMIKECPLCMECRLWETLEMPTNTLFLGEIVGMYAGEEFLTDGKPDIVKMNPFVLTMPDNGYRAVGEYLGAAWKAGLKLKNEG